jgi:hypothetical protein
MGATNITTILNLLDGLTDNQLKMVSAYGADLLKDRRQARAMERRRLQNVPTEIAPAVSQKAAGKEGL